MNIIKKSVCFALMMFVAVTFCVSTATADEYQWKYKISNMDDRLVAVEIFDFLLELPGVFDVDINVLRQSAFVFFYDEVIDETQIKKELIKAGYQVEQMQPIYEPQTGIM